MVLGLHSRCFSGGLDRDWLAWSLGLPLVWIQHKAAAQEIKACSAIHVALEHLQPVDVPFHRAGTPGQGDACLDRRIVALETFCQAPKRGQRARCSLLQPRIELLRLPGASCAVVPSADEEGRKREARADAPRARRERRSRGDMAGSYRRKRNKVSGLWFLVPG